MLDLRQLKPAVDWAKGIGLNIVFDRAENEHYWQGDGNLYLGGREDLICHEIGHYVVCPPDRRKLPDYGLEFYSGKVLAQMITDGLSTPHTIEDGRAGLFGHYLRNHLKLNTWVDDFFSDKGLVRSHRTDLAKIWLRDNNIIDCNNIPTGIIFAGQWKLA